MWTFIQGVLYSFLPKAYWRGWKPNSTISLERSAIVSGVLEFTLCTWLLVRNYVAFLVLRQPQLSPVASANSGTQLYFAGVVTIEYVLRPLSLVLAFLALEGGVRAIAAFLTEDVLPSLPAKVASSLHMFIKGRQAEKQLGPIVPDAVEWLQGPEYVVRISSSRPKEGWRSSTTIAINDELYDLAAEERGEVPRSFVYMLRKQPAEKIVRSLYRYQPGE